MTPPPRLAHRVDIDGLRGIAVLSVLAVHAFPEQVTGGFIGVDIFFVLSGYLISSIICRSLEAGQFSFLDFYARRVRRIFPALCTVLLACLAFGAVFTLPSEARQLGRHVAASSLFASNIALWLEAGYFDSASEWKPLLHLWSLGIEEQFYIFWPLAAALLFRWKRYALPLIGAALLVSFALNLLWVIARPTGTFFLLPTRAWELLLGVLLAYLMLAPRGGRVAAWLRARLTAGSWPARQLPHAMALLGAAMIAVVLARIDRSDPYPGWWALLPTVGTVLIIAAGSQARFNRRVLSNRILVFYGSISYPLYLWHWPLLVFPTLIGVALEPPVRVLILAASVGLAALTVEFIEQPLRRGQTGRGAPQVLCALLATIGVAGWALQQSDGRIASYPTSVRAVAAAEFGFDFSAYRASRCFLDLEQGPAVFAPECWRGPGGADKTVLLWGDSHAASLYPGLAAALPDDAGRHLHLAQLTKARCPPLLAPPPCSSRACREANAFVLHRVAANPPDTVVLGAYWSLYGDDGGPDGSAVHGLRQTIERLEAHGVRRVVVMGHLPTWTLPLPRILMREWERTRVMPERSRASLNPRALAMDGWVRAAVSGTGATFVSAIDAMCDAQGCLVSNTRGGVAYPLAHDQSHLTVAGSVSLIRRSAALMFN